MKDIWRDYKYAKKVILSCDDHLQLTAARRYMNLWFKKYTYVGKYNIRVADSVVPELYDKLKAVLYVKKHELTKHIDK